MSERKLFEPDNDGPECQLVVESYPDSPYRYCYYRQGNSEALANAGTATVHPAMAPGLTGAFATEGPIVDWSYTEYHANGDRVRVDHRLVVNAVEAPGVVIRHETAREEVLGFGDREEHGWKLIEGWRVTPDEVSELEVSNDVRR